MFEELAHIEERYRELTHVMAAADVDTRHAMLNEYEDVLRQIERARELLEEDDSEMAELAQRELDKVEPRAEQLAEQMALLNYWGISHRVREHKDVLEQIEAVRELLRDQDPDIAEPSRHELAQLESRAEQLAGQLDRLSGYGQERHGLEPVALRYREYRDVLKQIEAARELLEEEGSEVAELARQELTELESRAEQLSEQLRQWLRLLPENARDQKARWGIFEDLAHTEERYNELTEAMAAPQITDRDHNRLAWERAELEPIVHRYREYEDVLRQIEGARQLLEKEDSEIVELARHKLDELEPRAGHLTEQLRLALMLMLRDPGDVKHLIDVWIKRQILMRERKIRGPRGYEGRWGKPEVWALEYDAGNWTYEEIQQLEYSPDKLWPVILEMIRLAPSDQILADIAAFPLEDLIVHRHHAEEFVDRIEQEARRDPKFRLCLTGVWYQNSLPEHLRVRLDRCTAGSGRL